LSVEMELLLSILKLTASGAVSYELVNKDANIPSATARKLLGKLQNEGLVYCRLRFIEVDTARRLELAVRAVRLGADLERVSTFLSWREFEAVAAMGLEQNGHSVARNLRFKHGGRRWEVDIVGSRKPLAVCVDCKHWRHGLHLSKLRKIVEEQVDRTSALAQALPNLVNKTECASWNHAKLVPVVLSLTTGNPKFLDNVPIVPVLQVQDFLNQLPACADSLFFVRV